jgi:AcrR family transcriptional regulator
VRGVSASPKRFGRPRDEDADEKILEAALARLVRSGYERLRVDDVAADAGAGR